MGVYMCTQTNLPSLFVCAGDLFRLCNHPDPIHIFPLHRSVMAAHTLTLHAYIRTACLRITIPSKTNSKDAIL